MRRTIVLYATKYGSTQEVAESLAEKLDIPSKNVSNVNNISELEQYDTLILGAPIYYDDIFEDMKHFINSFFIKIGEKKSITFVVYGAVKGHLDKDYAQDFANYFQPNPALTFGFLGRATRSALSSEDYRRLDIFFKNRLNAELSEFDYFDENRLDEAVQKIKEIL